MRQALQNGVLAPLSFPSLSPSDLTFASALVAGVFSDLPAGGCDTYAGIGDVLGSRSTLTGEQLGLGGLAGLGARARLASVTVAAWNAVAVASRNLSFCCFNLKIVLVRFEMYDVIELVTFGGSNAG